jgi:hypothetical protein
MFQQAFTKEPKSVLQMRFINKKAAVEFVHGYRYIMIPMEIPLDHNRTVTRYENGVVINQSEISRIL